MEKSYISKFLNEQKNKPLFLIATDNNSFYIYNIANALVDNDMLTVITKKPYTTYSFPLHNASPHINIAKKYKNTLEIIYKGYQFFYKFYIISNANTCYKITKSTLKQKYYHILSYHKNQIYTPLYKKIECENIEIKTILAQYKNAITQINNLRK